MARGEGYHNNIFPCTVGVFRKRLCQPIDFVRAVVNELCSGCEADRNDVPEDEGYYSG